MKHRRFYKFVVLACITCMGASALLSVWCPMLEANPATDPAPGKESTRPPATRWPLNQHGIAAEHKLFLAPEQGTSPQREMPQAGTSSASKSLGLKLKGTVVTGHQGLNVAIIERLGRQQIYYEGDRAGQVQIQKVLRNKAIIRIGSRDELLAITFQKNSKEALALKLPGQNEQQPATGAAPPIRLDRVELVSSLENLHELMKSARIHSYKNKKGTKPAGFLLSSIKPGSLLAKMGLRNGDVITGVNDEPVTSGQQAIDFYNTVVEGGDIALKIKRRGNPQTLRYKIQ